MQIGHRHPMKPHRLTLTNSLVMNYGLHKKMKVNISIKTNISKFVKP